jgi:hypothetical protein
MAKKVSPYRVLSVYNDVKAARKGPKPYAKRIVRKAAYRSGNKTIRRVLRVFGL